MAASENARTHPSQCHCPSKERVIPKSAATKISSPVARERGLTRRDGTNDIFANYRERFTA
jgi:hypothetical protein